MPAPNTQPTQLAMDMAATYKEVAFKYLTTTGLQLGKNILSFLLVLIIASFVSKAVRRAIGLAIERSSYKPSALFTQFATNVAGKAVWIIGLIVALGNLGIDTQALVASLGVSGIVLGFALKDTLSNFASGMMIMFYRPFDVGHMVNIGGTEGTIRDLTLVATVVTTGDNKVITVPNAKVWGSTITNFSVSPTRRVDLVIGVDYDSDIDETQALLLDILTRHDLVLTEPAPAVTLKELGADSVNFNVRGWVNNADYWKVYNLVLREIKLTLDERKIIFPFPQREVWVHMVEDKTKTPTSVVRNGMEDEPEAPGDKIADQIESD